MDWAILAIHVVGIVIESEYFPDAAWTLPGGTARKLQSVWYRKPWAWLGHS